MCTGNSARSQMAEGLANFFGKGRIQAFSAGIRPSALSPYAVRAMAEIGVDISSQRAKDVKEFLGQPFDYIITLCDSARQSCPVFSSNAKRLHWDITDPVDVKGTEEDILLAFRQARDKIKSRIKTEI
ncbi:MAG: arsenate reductase ArsC [Planctomycetota bacterium]